MSFILSLSYICELSDLQSFCSTRISISRKLRQKFRRIMSLMEFPTDFSSSSSSSVTLRVFVSPEGFPLGMEDMKLQRHWTALALPRVGYPGVFYFACRLRCYLVRYAEILTNLSLFVLLLLVTPTLRDCCS